MIQEYTFLMEIGTDELPCTILKKLGKDFLNSITLEFKKNNICCHSTNWFAAPRHLAIKSKIVITNQTYQTHNYFNNQDYISNYSNKNINSQNFNKKNLINNQNFKNLLLIIIHNTFKNLTNYKMMRWGELDTPFIRPINSIVILLDSQLVKGQFFNIYSDRITHGHRCTQNNKIILHHADDYPNILSEKGFIIVNYNQRKEIIRLQIKQQASKLGGIVDIQDNNLLEQITSSTEWPTVLSGKFNKRFLKLPIEILIHIMKKKQRYFPVYNTINGILLPYFIFVTNTITKNYNKIINGHENIITSRFMDIEFFLKKDAHFCLEDYIPKLNSILFHNKLGNLKDKINRITALSKWIANQINEDITQTTRASYLCKCDLMTEMVLEFPEMQGIIGMHYARRDKESEKVALAQKEHYYPKHTDDILPTEQISCIISIADKMDTLSGILGIQDFPTGSRDPFELKRITTGIIRIIIQKKIPLNLIELINKSIELYEQKLTKTAIIKKNIYKFMIQRLYLYYRSQGFKTNVIKSVLNDNTKISNLINCNTKINVFNDFYNLQKEKSTQLKITYKRISNILKTQDPSLKNKIIVINLLQKTEEKQLFEKINKMQETIKLLLNNNQYYDALMQIIDLSDFTNNFLNQIYILNQNEDIKNNRLILLSLVKFLIEKVVDLSLV